VSQEWKPNNLSICYEAFSLPLALAVQLQRENLADAALYAKIVAELGKDTVRQESLITRMKPSAPDSIPGGCRKSS
jgi:hypothetical protein